MEVIFWIGIVLGVITVLGHGIWVLLAWMFRGFQPRQSMKVCPRCGTGVSVFPCRQCGFGAQAPDRFRSTRQVLNELRSKALIDPATHSTMGAALFRLEHQGTQWAGAPAVPPTGPTAGPAPAQPEIVEAKLAEAPAPSAPSAEVAATPVQETPAIPLARPGLQAIPPRITRPIPPHIPPRMPAQAPPAPRPMPAPRPPSKPFTEILKAFMEERNIRWGELVGGMLIVGCSVALVLSLWAQISQRPFLKVGVFTGVVAGLFGLGLYADRKWKLPATSYAILLIAMLMVPLHFCAMVVIGGQSQGPLVMAVEAVGVMVLVALSYLAAGVVSKSWRTLAAAGSVAISLSGPALYLAGVLHAGQQDRGIFIAAAIIVGLMLVFTTMANAGVGRLATWSATSNREAASLLGVLLFAGIPSLAMHGFLGAEAAHYRNWIAPMYALLAIPLLDASASLMRRNIEPRNSWHAAGWTIGLFAMLGLFMVTAMAWPIPLSIASTGAISFVILLGHAALYRRTMAIVAACAMLMAGYVALMPAIFGRASWSDMEGALAAQFWTDHLAIQILPAALALAIIGVTLRKRVEGAIASAGGMAGAIVVLAMAHLLVTVYGRGIPLVEAPYLLGACAAGAMAGAVVAGNTIAATAGSALAILTVERIWPGSWFNATAAACTVLAVLRIVAARVPGTVWVRVRPLVDAQAWWTLAAASAMWVGAVHLRDLQQDAWLTWWLSGIGLLMLLGRVQGVELAIFQFLLSGAIVMQTLATGNAHFALNDPRLLLICCMSLVAQQGLWAAITPACAHLRLPRALVDAPSAPPRVAGVGAAIVAILMCAFAFSESAASELQVSAMPVEGLFTFAGSWMAMLLIVVVAVIERLVSGNAAWLTMATVGVYGFGAAIAVRVSSEMAASAIRFSSIIGLVLLSAPAWAASRLGKWAEDFRTPGVRATSLVLGAIPLVALTVLAAQTQLSHTGPRAPAAGTLWANIGAIGSYIVPMGALALVLAGHALQRRSEALAVLAVLTVNLTATLAFMLERGANTSWDFVVLLWLNVVAMGVCIGVWLLLRELLLKLRDEAPASVRALSAVASLTIVVLGCVHLAQVLVDHARAGLAMGDLAIGWVGLGLVIWLAWRLWRERFAASGMFWALICVSALAAQSVMAATTMPWTALRSSLVTMTVGVGVIYFLGRLIADHLAGAEVYDTDLGAEAAAGQTPGQLGYFRSARAGSADAGVTRFMVRVRVWGIAAAVVAFLFAARDMMGDPQRPWWTIASLVSLASLAVVIAQRELRPGYLYHATVAICVAGGFLWGSHYWVYDVQRVRDLAMLIVTMLGACGIVSIILERQVFAPSGDRVIRRTMPLHLPASVVSVSVLFLIGVLQLLSPRQWASQPEGLAVAMAACAGAAGLAIARLWDPRSRASLGLIYVATLAILAVVLDLGAGWGVELIQRCLICTIGLTIAWGVLLRRYGDIGAWLTRLSAQTPDASILPQCNAWLGIVALWLILLHEVTLYATRGFVPMSTWLIIVLCVLLLTAAGVLIATALSRIADPLLLPFRKRETYVYAAEVVVGLLFVHVRLTCPWLFSGFLEQYWPLVVMVIAYVLAGVGELLSRRSIAVIGVPLVQTAFILPFVPAIGFAVVRSEAPYAAVMASAAVFYGAWATLRKTPLALVLALLALNGTIWSLLWGHEALSLSQHPQLWFIPPALCMVVAAQLLRDKLDRNQAAILRYVGMLMAYLASTADVLLIGVANAPWLAGVLALISVIGVMAGIMLRVRSFLYTGTAFLAVSLLTLIYHATANLHQTWLLWLSGIALGLGILMAFAMFERHKERLTRMMDELRAWET